MITVIVILSFLLTVGALSFTPYITRKTELFGVTIPAAVWGHEKCRSLRSSYRKTALAAGILFTAAGGAGSVFLPMDTMVGAAFFIAAIFLYLAISFALYLVQHYRAKRLKADMGWTADAETAVLVVDTEAPQGDTLSPRWFLLYPLVVAATILGIFLAWPYAPDPIPMHYNIAGLPDQFAPKSPGAVLPLLLTQVLEMAVFALTYLIIRRAKRQIDAADEQVSRRQGRRFRRVISASLLFGGVLMGLYLGALQIFMLLNGDSRLIIGSSIVLLILVGIGLAAMMYLVGQGGSRIRIGSGGPGASVNRDDDRYWKLGLFYFNPADPALFLEKRFGLGYAVNYGRPASWVILGGIVFLIIGSIAIAVFFKKG
jgi:uncharacterized membrane protein